MTPKILTDEDVEGLLRIAEGMSKVADNLKKSDEVKYRHEINVLALSVTYLLMLTSGPCECDKCRKQAAANN